jgi:hypothetical protein
VPDIPPEVYAAVDAALDGLPQPESQFERDRWRITSRAALDAAAPILAEAVARKIREHMETWSPTLTGAQLSRWRRHMGIAARIAELTFTTRDELIRDTAASIASEVRRVHQMIEPADPDLEVPGA